MWRNLVPYLIGGIATIGSAAPAIYTIWRFGAGAQADLATTLDAPSVWNHEVWGFLLQLPLNRGWEFHWLGENYVWPAPIHQLAIGSIAILAICLLFGLILSIRPIFERFADKDNEKRVWLNLVLGALLASPLLFWYSSSDVAVHYLLPTFPASVLLISGVASNKQWGQFIFSGVCLIGLLYGIQTGQGLNIISESLAPHGMGTPLKFPEVALQQALDSTDRASTARLPDAGSERCDVWPEL